MVENYWINTIEDHINGEVWMPITDYEDFYLVSNYGRVRSLDKMVRYIHGMRKIKGRIIKQFLNSKGYPFVVMRDKPNQRTREVHRLVAQAFIPNPENKPCVNHMKGIKTNNLVSELEWCTYSENNFHAFRVLKRKQNFKGVFGKDNPRSKAVIQLDINGVSIKRWDSMEEAVKSHGFLKSKISNCCKGKRQTHAGFKWSYAN